MVPVPPLTIRRLWPMMSLLLTAWMPMFSPFISGLLSGVIAGVLVSVFSQFLLKGIVEPAQQLKGKIAEIGMQLELLNNRYSSTDKDYVIMKYDIDLINRLSAEIHSLPYQILIYSKIRYLFGLPSYNIMKKLYCKLNELSYVLATIESIEETMKKLPFQLFQEESFQKENPRRSLTEQVNRNISYIKRLSQEIKKLLSIRQLSQPPASPSKNFQASR